MVENKKQGMIPAITSFIIVSLIVISAGSFVIYQVRLIGPVLIILGLVPLIPLKLSGRTIKSAGADIVFGAIDTGILGGGGSNRGQFFWCIRGHSWWCGG